MMNGLLETKAAPAERAEAAILADDVLRFREDAMAVQLLGASPDMFLILNEQRQIVFANEPTAAILGVQQPEEILGLRVGEAVDCEHAHVEPGGCGTSEFCRECGALQGMMTSLSGRRAVRECRITRANGDSLDLRVTARPLTMDGRAFTTFAITDIADEKRRRVLERIFFHDILNTAGGMLGIAELLTEATPEELDEYKPLVYTLSHSLVDEIKAQQTLSAAEAGELSVEPMRLNSLSLLYELVAAYANHEVAIGRALVVEPGTPAICFESDKALVRRVVGNMIKNALEASHPGQQVTVSCRQTDGSVEFTVHNPNEMPRSVQLQVFQRSFSTKGSGRGLGTYSMRLLTEQFLHGSVGFASSAEAGTTFFARYPLVFPG